MLARSDAWLISGARSAFGKFGGGLADVSVPDLGTQIITSAIGNAAFPGASFSEFNVGIGMVEAGLMVPARQIAMSAGLPESLPTMTIDRACCSGLTVVGLAMKSIQVGARSVLCLGIESMSNTPRLLFETRWGKRRGDLTAQDLLLMRSPISGDHVATYAGKVAIEYGIDREEQDQWALGSHERYFRALEAGYFDLEIAPVQTPAGEFSMDEQPRRDTSLDQLGRLVCVYDSPTVTAGNAPGLNDGACALIVADEATALSSPEPPLARLHSYVQIAESPTSSPYLPGIAILELINEAGLSIEELDVIEINEAYAATPLVSIRELTKGDRALEGKLRERTNPNGGAVAIGHPVGCSGARVVLTAALELKRRGGKWAVAAICGGFGQTDAVLIGRATA